VEYRTIFISHGGRGNKKESLKIIIFMFFYVFPLFFFIYLSNPPDKPTDIKNIVAEGILNY
jgi:hypothetical protein